MNFFKKVKSLVKKKKNIQPSLEEPQLARIPLSFKIYQQPIVSIIIPFYNQEHYTWNCLKHLKEGLSENYPYEIILIDDNSSEIMDFSLLEGVKIYTNQVNQGFLKNINIGIQKATGDYIYILNNDTEVKEGFLDELFYVFENFENVGAVGSKLLNIDHSLQEAGAAFMKGFKIHQIVRNKFKDSPEVNFINKVDYCSGCSLLFKKFSDDGILNQFDVDFAPAYFEETDFCFQLRHHQKKEIYYTGFSEIYHFDGVSYNNTKNTDTNKERKKELLFATNKQKFQKKWNDIIENINSNTVQERVLELYGNKSILFFHNEIPRFDVDSGSNRLKEIMEVFVKEGFLVSLVVESLRYKDITEKYINYYQRKGINVYFKNQRDTNYKQFLQNNYLGSESIIWFYGPGSYKTYYKTCKAMFKKSRFVYDMIDIHHLRMKRTLEINPNDKWCLKNIKKYEKIELSLNNKVDYIVTISDEEKEYMSKYYNKNKLITLSNIHYLKKDPTEIKHFKDRKDLLFVGSTHHPNINAVQWLIDEIMPSLWEIDSTIKLHIVGNVKKAFDNISVDNRILFHGYVASVEHFFEDVKMMVAPLKIGAGVKGKLGQALEYSLPIVTTSIGAEGMNMKNNESALISNTTLDFVNSVAELNTNEELWYKLSNNSKKSLEPYDKENVRLLIDKHLL